MNGLGGAGVNVIHESHWVRQSTRDRRRLSGLTLSAGAHTVLRRPVNTTNKFLD
jgi:hypothetical protein